MIDPARQYVTACEAAELTGKGEHTIRRMIKDGRLAAVKVASNRYAILRSDLDNGRPSVAERLDGIEAFLSAYFGLTERKINAETAYNALQRQSERPKAPHGPIRAPVASRASGEAVMDTRGHAWPASHRGRARIVAEATGRNFLTVRDWPVRRWDTKEAAEQWLRDRKGISIVL